VPNTSAVPYSALTHLIWWDNQDATGVIEQLIHNGTPNTEECQFLCAEQGSDTFSVGYRAYFPDQPVFLWYHNLVWMRGLGGPSGSLAVAGTGNIGEPPSAPGVSGSETFSNMLSPHSACSFAVRLRVYVKTFNGYGRMSGYDADVTAAFALQIGDC
jgi:hypothetical protein